MNQNTDKVETEMDKAQKSEDNSLEPFITTEGTPYQITEEGSLGILAMGYAGIMLWRDKKYNLSVNPLKKEKEK